MAYVAESAEVNMKSSISMVVLIGEFTSTPLVEIRPLFALTLAMTRTVDGHFSELLLRQRSRDEDVAMPHLSGWWIDDCCLGGQRSGCAGRKRECSSWSLPHSCCCCLG
jgi:hypothetical protein